MHHRSCQIQLRSGQQPQSHPHLHHPDLRHPQHPLRSQQPKPLRRREPGSPPGQQAAQQRRIDRPAGGTRDFDWYYIDVTDPHQAVTPVYFSCDKKYGFYHEGFKADETPPEPYWTINYYYDPDSRTPEGLVEQSSYVVYKEMCKRGDAETKGPFRFQMNTERPGRYYIRIWGRYVGQRTEADAPTTTTVVQKQDDNRVYVTTVSSTGVELTVNSGGNSIQNKLDIGQSTTIGTVSVTLQSTTVAAKLNIDGTEVTIPDGGTQVVDGSTVKVSSVTNNIATVTITSGSVTETRTIVTDWIDSIAGKRVRLVSTTLEARLNVGGADRTVAQGDSFNAPAAPRPWMWR